MNLKYLAFAGISLLTFLCACSPSNAGGSGTPPPPPTPPPAATASADDTLHLLQAKGALPTLDASSSLLGTDNDGNGVRDDIDKYIAGLSDTSTQKKALTQEARAVQSTLMLDTTNAASLTSVATAIDRSVSCIHAQYSSGASSKVTTIESLSINTMTRMQTYQKFNSALNGSVGKGITGSSCD